MMTSRSYFRSLSRIAADLRRKHQNPHSIPVVYFTGTPNVGDLLNEYLIPKLSGKSIVQVSSSMTPHMRAIGSVIGSASQFSHVWGSGSIDGRKPNRAVRKENIHALRGCKTREMLSATLGADLVHIPLGDPAVLMPNYFMPQVSKSIRIGIIPHFSDEAILTDYLRSVAAGQTKIISVRQQPEDFIAELCSCDYVFSSSLHGLILADSYNVPNKWISASSHVLGGRYKFQDYYSTTDGPAEDFKKICGWEGLRSLIERADAICTVKPYINSKRLLAAAFPLSFTNRF